MNKFHAILNSFMCFNLRWHPPLWMRWAAGGLLVVLLVLRFSGFSPWVSELISPDRMIPDGGYAYKILMSNLSYADTGGHAYSSSLLFFEDGTVLEPHVGHDLIRGKGQGVYSHWGGDDTIRFAASDNSDPRINGRVYKINYQWLPPAWLLWIVILIFSFLNQKILWRVRDGVRKAMDMLSGIHVGWILLLILIAALGYRVVMAHLLWDSSFFGVQVQGIPFSDALGWWSRGANLEYGQNVYTSADYWDARRQGYAWFLGTVFSLFGDSTTPVRVIQILLGVASAGFIFDVLRRMLPLPVAILSTFIHVFLMYDAQNSLIIMSGSLGYFLSNFALWLLVLGVLKAQQKGEISTWLWYIGWSGVMISCSNMVRPLNLLALVPMALYAGYLFLAGGQRIKWWKGVAVAFVMVVGASVVLTPWLLRQHSVYGIWALSDNSSEMLFAATSPEYGNWTSKVSELTPGMDISERYKFYQEGAMQHIIENPGWYALHVAGYAAKHLRILHAPRWILLLTLLIFLCSMSLRISNPQQIRLYSMVSIVGLFILFSSASTYAIAAAFFCMGSSLWFVVRGHSLGILSVFLLPTIASLGLMAAGLTMRFDYSLQWVAAALTSGGLWYLLHWGSGKPVNIPQCNKKTYNWQWFQRIFSFLAVAVVMTLLVGVSMMIRHQLQPKKEMDLSYETPVQQSTELIGEFLSSEKGADFTGLKARLAVYNIMLDAKWCASFSKDEDIRHWSPLFAPRNYLFSACYPFPKFPPYSQMFFIPIHKSAMEQLSRRKLHYIVLKREVDGALLFEVLAVVGDGGNPPMLFTGRNPNRHFNYVRAALSSEMN